MLEIQLISQVASKVGKHQPSRLYPTVERATLRIDRTDIKPVESRRNPGPEAATRTIFEEKPENAFCHVGDIQATRTA